MAFNQQRKADQAAAKEAKAQYLADRQAEAEDLNAEVDEQVGALQSILEHTLGVDDRINFDTLRSRVAFEAFKTPSTLAPRAAPKSTVVEPLTWLQGLIPGASGRHARAVEKARAEDAAALASHEKAEAAKAAQLAKAMDEHAQRKAAYDGEQLRKNTEVDEFEADYRAKDAEAVVAYNEMVLTRSEYPEEGFPQSFRLAYNTSSSELVVEYELPLPSVVPAEAEYKYVKTRDEIESKPRKPAEVKKLYQDLVAAVTLRTLHELFEADQANALNLVTFTGVLDTVDPASGRDTRVPVVSVRAPKGDFEQLRLDKVDKIVCLRNLGAQVSSRPDELQAVKPIVEFDMVDKRFIEQGDVLSGLESRPNLMDLTPSEFEVLVSNLFGKMGLETKLTRSSRDGGVDAVAFDARPVLGGKVVIQAKRYRDTVGVSAVRDLYGTMLNEGASKGILVCTSGFGVDAYNFSKDKPLELIDGGGLLYLLREHAGTHARIAS
ncbi:restriction endonuclease [Paucibacter sp. R3-3]|uniref:Restriction endonuclease n=1 Tax=Roseateles agri TaxID=3098619 RepID=A0ABU5DEU5_9BURK|nr:restriction endonuclease [Paucibacter sp. R3-3]MDY0744791.1 restriction endonuclease [Paucibacter sp. R3-3]